MLYLFCFILAHPILSRSIARGEERQVLAQACDSMHWNDNDDGAYECNGKSVPLYDTTVGSGCSRMNQHPQPGDDKGYESALVFAGTCSLYEYDEYYFNR